MTIELAEDNDSGGAVNNAVPASYHKRLLHVIWSLQNRLYNRKVPDTTFPQVLLLPLSPYPGFAISVPHLKIFVNFPLELDDLKYGEVALLHLDLSKLEEFLNLNQG